MDRETRFYCPECDEGLDLTPMRSRRLFLQSMAGAATVAAAGLSTSTLRGEDKPADSKPAEPKNPVAEALIRELYSGLEGDQKKELIVPYNHAEGGRLTRQRTFNTAPFNKRMRDTYTPVQRDMVQRIVKSILSGDEAFERISRHGSWDSSGSFDGCGAVLFGSPVEGEKFSWTFSGHHLTLRCDGDSQPGAAFGGPVYYGHSANGYSARNVYLYQTQQVNEVFKALDEKQRAKSLSRNNPGGEEGGLRPLNPRHGIAYSELTADQQALVEKVMRVLLEPFRKQDGDEVMSIVKANGGLNDMHVAFYRDAAMQDDEQWHFWRLEAPGFVWNFRPLPHVHCFVNISLV